MTNIILPRSVVEQALSTLEGWGNYDKWVWPESALSTAKKNTAEMIPALRTALKQTQTEPVAYEYVEYRPYGAPGEIKRATILMEHYRLPNGSIAGDYEWLIQQFKSAKTTISMRPLYAGPYIVEKGCISAGDEK